MASLSRAEWRSIAIAGYGPTLVSSIGFGCVNPLIAFSAGNLGASLGVAAFIVGLLSLGGWLGNIPAGIVASKIGEKKAMIMACLIDAAVMLTVFCARSLPALGIATFICGMTSSIFGIARQSFLTEAVPPHARGRALSTLGGTFRVGFMIGPILGALVTRSFGLPAAYAFAACTSLCAAAITLAIPDVEHEAERLSFSPADTSLVSVISHNRKPLLTVGVGCMALSAIRASRQTLIPLWCRASQLSPQTTSLIVAASMAFDVLLFFPGGWLMDHVGRWWLCVPSLLTMSTMLLLLPLTHTQFWIAAVAMGLGIGNGLSSGILMTLGADNSPAVGRPKFLAAFRMVAGTGDAGGPLAISLLTFSFPLFVAALVMGTVGFVGAAWLNLWVPKRPVTR